jgi:hypothetical protein
MAALQLQEVDAMTLRLLVRVSALSLVAATPALACERHQATTALTTATAAPVIVAPAAADPVDAVAPEASDAAVTVVPQATAAPYSFGRCRKDGQTTVYLTN